MKKPSNKKVICEEIIKTGKYQNEKSRGSEDIWVIAYLENFLFVKKDYIYEFWKNLYQTKYGTIKDEYFATKLFEEYYKKSKSVKFDEDVFCIYQEDIDRIQNMEIKKWQKEFIFCFIVWADINKKYNFWEIPYRKFLKFCHYNPREAFDPKPIVEIMLSCGLLTEKIDKCFDNREGVWDELSYYHLNKTKDRKNKIDYITYFEDVKRFFDSFSSTSVCSICGIIFEKGPKTKRDCCLECWKKKRKKDEHERYLKSFSAGMQSNTTLGRETNKIPIS